MRYVLVLIGMLFTATAQAQYLTPAVNSPLFPSTPSAKFVPKASSGSAADWAQLACSDLSNASAFCSGTSAANLTATLLAAQFPALTGDITTSAGALATTIAANAVTNAKMSTMNAWTIKMNNTSGAAVPTDTTIDGLTLKATPTTSDEIPIWDAAASAMKKTTMPSVLLSGIVLAKTAAYPAVTGDCGSTITLGGSAQYTLTLNAASGYTANCGFLITNLASETRTKTIAVDGLTSFFLYPGQSALVSNQSNTWHCDICNGRYKLTGATTFYIRPDGSDGGGTNDGLANSAAGAFKTPNQCMSTIQGSIDINASGGGSVICQHTCASPPCTINNTTPSQFLLIVGYKFVGGVPTYQGDITTPTNMKLIANAAQQAVIQSTFSDEINVGGFELGGGANLLYGMYVSGGGTRVNITSPIQCDAISGTNGGGFASGVCLLANSQGNIYNIASTMVVAGSMGAIFSAVNGGFIENAVALTLTLSGTPAWSAAAAYVVLGGVLNFPSLTNSGSSTGSRFSAQFGGEINTGVGTCAVGSTYFPGNSNGSIGFASGNVGNCF